MDGRSADYAVDGLWTAASGGHARRAGTTDGAGPWTARRRPGGRPPDVDGAVTAVARRCGPAGGHGDQPATTSTVTGNSTSAWSLTGTRWVPTVLDRLVELELLAVELDAGLGGDGLGDVGRGDRAEQLALGAHAGRDGDRARTRASWRPPRRRVRSAASLMSRERRMPSAWASAPARGLEGQPAGQEEVAAVAVGDVDDVALVADALDVGAEDDAHQASTSAVSTPSPANSSPPSSTSSPSSSPPVGGGAVGRGGGPSARMPRSPPRSPPRPPRCCVTRLA